MKIGVISDIHSNIVAFRACVDYLEEEGCFVLLCFGYAILQGNIGFLIHIYSDAYVLSAPGKPGRIYAGTAGRPAGKQEREEVDLQFRKWKSSLYL